MLQNGAFSDYTKRIVFGRARGRCEICGVKVDGGHFHHRKPRRMGGTSDLTLGMASNAMYLHFKCHERVESNRMDSYKLGYLVSAIDNPTEIAVRLWDGWWRLDDDGSLVASCPSDLAGEALRDSREAASPAEVGNGAEVDSLLLP